MAYTTIDDPEAYFQAKIYSGTGSSQALTFDGDTDMQPDFLWFKVRNSTGTHAVFDSVRGTTGSVYRRLTPQDNAAEDTAADTLTTIGSDGFTVISDPNINQSGETYVAWCWKESADAGFDIATFTGNGSAQNISHSLSAVPKMVITKSRSATGAWYIYHAGVASDAETDYLVLDTNAAVGDASTVWNDTAPTSSVFSVGSGFDDGTTYVAYAFAPKQGFSKFSEYYGNGQATGTTVWCGFTPAFVMIKSTASGVWRMWDNKRDALNPNTANFQANAVDAEYDHSSVAIDFLSSGFKARSTDSSYNGNGVRYVFMAFAEASFVNSNGVPCNAR